MRVPETKTLPASRKDGTGYEGYDGIGYGM